MCALDNEPTRGRVTARYGRMAPCPSSTPVRAGELGAAALKEITGLKPAVDTFFDKVMVMAEDKSLRENRVRFLTEIGNLFNQVADFSKIQD